MKQLRMLIALAAVTALSTGLSAQGVGKGGAKPAAPRKNVAKAAGKKDATEEKLKALDEALNKQQAVQQQLIDQLRETRQQLLQTEEKLNQVRQTAQAAADHAEENKRADAAFAAKAAAALTEAKSQALRASDETQKVSKRVDAVEHPASIAYKGIRLTPGGFLELTQYYRSHATLSDLATPFQAIPLEAQVSGGYNTHLREYGVSARSSRITLRTDADAGKTKLAGFFELDFNGAGTTSNTNQTTSYTPRMRQGWGRATFANGWSITGGQSWSLITLNRKGVSVDNASLWIPNTIEAQYSVGYNWGRFAELRIAKELNKQWTVAVALDNPSYLNSGANASVSGLAANGNGTYANPNVTYSTTLAPDVLAKIAYDNPRYGHYELKSLARVFRDRVVPTSSTGQGWNNTLWGGGVGAGAIVPIKAKKVDFIAQGLWGRGVSRYQDAGQYDFVVRSTDHGLQAIQSFSVLAGFETHPTPKFELDTFFGDEYYARSTYLSATLLNGSYEAGYGARNADNSAAYYETPPAGATTAGNNRNLWNAKVVAYYDLYKGYYGTLRYGVEADYVERCTWSGANGLAPKGNEKIAFTTMRYILP